MKKTLVVSCALALFVFALPSLFGEREKVPEPPAPAEKTGAKEELYGENAGLIYVPREEKTAPIGRDTETPVRAQTKGQTETADLHTYLCGVVAAEMPASFENEALKAQAVAARTFVLYRMTVEPAKNHPEADVCDDISCCKAYFSREELLERWGESFEENMAKIENAVSETDGLCLTYGGEPIFAAFHSSSAGYTESAENVFGGDLPYLQSVFSPESAENVPNYNTEVSVTFDDFRKTVFEKYPGAVFSVNPDNWISGVVRSPGGRITEITVGGVTMTGTDFRFLFSLRSANAEIDRTADGFLFHVSGYGHGVGMSQYGANALAQAGSGFEEILAWYYPGTELTDIIDIKK